MVLANVHGAASSSARARRTAARFCGEAVVSGTTTASPSPRPLAAWTARPSLETNTTNDTVYLGALADSGKCYYIKDVSNAPGAGVTYATAASSAGSCGKPSTATGFNSDPGVGWTS